MASQENKRIVVAICNNCGGNTSKPEGWRDTVFCKAECQTEDIQKAKAKVSDAETDKFLAANESYYDCPYNNKLIVDLLAAWKLEPTAPNLDSAYLHLLAERKLLTKLSMSDVQKLTSPEYDARLKIDPAMGGAITDIEEAGAKKFDSPVSYKTGGTGGWEKMAQANLAQRQADADARSANRYRGSR